MRQVAGERGFEPRLPDPESGVLPLHYSPSCRWIIRSGPPRSKENMAAIHRVWKNSTPALQNVPLLIMVSLGAQRQGGAAGKISYFCWPAYGHGRIWARICLPLARNVLCQQPVRWFAARRPTGRPKPSGVEIFGSVGLRGSSPIPESPGHSPWDFHGARAARHRTAPS